jgi:hypothetical protein
MVPYDALNQDESIILDSGIINGAYRSTIVFTYALVIHKFE